MRTKVFYLLMNKFTMFLGYNLSNHFALFRCRKPVFNKRITDAIIFKRHDEVINNRIPQPKFIRNIMIKDIKHILIVHTFWCRGQPQQKLRFKILDYFSIGFCSCMVTLIDNYIIELILTE